MKISFHNHNSARKVEQSAFTLIEVMVAVAIFFMAMFAILGVMGTCLHAAYLLHKPGPTAGMVAAELTLTNLADGDHGTVDFGDFYKGYKGEWNSHDYNTNVIQEVDITVYHEGNVDSTMVAYFFRPQSGKRMSR